MQQPRSRKPVTLASVAVLNGAFYAKAMSPVLRLRRALRSRRTIGQASGILVARHSCSLEEAFVALQLLAQQADVTILEAAAVVIAGADGSKT